MPGPDRTRDVLALNDILARYQSLGGTADRIDIEAHEWRLHPLEAHQVMILEHAIWELEHNL